MGVGCAKCHKLYESVTELVRKNKINCDVVKIEDIKQVAEYGVFMTPGLVIDGETKVAGKVPKESDILKWLKS